MGCIHSSSLVHPESPMVFPETFLHEEYTQKTPSPVKDSFLFQTQVPQTQQELNRYIERIHRATRRAKP
jgi:hypothetical protein